MDWRRWDSLESQATKELTLYNFDVQRSTFSSPRTRTVREFTVTSPNRYYIDIPEYTNPYDIWRNASDRDRWYAQLLAQRAVMP